MINSIDAIVEHAKRRGSKKLAVACAGDESVLSAVEMAREAGLIEAVLLGDRAEIDRAAEAASVDLSRYEIMDFSSKEDACKEAVGLVSSGKADFIMKGMAETATIMRAVLDRQSGLRTGKKLSHVSVMEVPGHHKLFIITDGAMNIEPGLDEKRQIIENAVGVARSIGIEYPKVAVLCAVEKVNPKMKATLDASELVKLNISGKIRGCIVGGPLALDNAVSKRSAAVKGIEDPVAGDADILVCPDIESGNILYKSLVFLAGARSAGLIAGASAPVVLTSRSDCEAVKFNSIALGVISLGKP